MALALYLNHNVPRAIAEGLRLRGIDVLTAYEDGTHEWSDPRLLDRAGEVGRVLFSMDRDLLAEATRRQRAGEEFAGLIYVHQEQTSVGRCVRDLELLATASQAGVLQGLVQYLPL